MPILLIHPYEVIDGAHREMSELSEQILKLSDLENGLKLEAGESVEARRHKIAKLGKRMAEVWAGVQEMLKTMREAHEQHAAAHGQPPPSSTPDDDDKAN
jgi:hypothetical protein